HRVRVAEGRLEVPHALEFPWLGRAVVPLVRTGHALVHKVIAGGLPRLTAIVRTLDLLAEPARRLAGIDAVGIHRRALQVVHLPAAEKWSTDIPLLALAVGRQDKRAFFGTDQNADLAH